MTDTIKKRDGRQVPFEAEKIEDAILKAFAATGSAKGRDTAQELTRQVVAELDRDEDIDVPTVEDVQDMVEKKLI